MDNYSGGEGGEECRFCSLLKQVVRTVNHCLKGLSYLVAIWLPLGRFIIYLHLSTSIQLLIFECLHTVVAPWIFSSYFWLNNAHKSSDKGTI